MRRQLYDKRSSTRGFTLVELMIALIAGAFAVSAVYYLNGVSSRGFAEQMRVSETQMSLRTAMEQLRRDFARAGYLSTPNSALIPGCGGVFVAAGTATAQRQMRALTMTLNGSTALNTTTGTLVAPVTNSTRVDQVDVWGNYLTPEVYLVDPVTSTSTKIVFQPSSEAFRRSFYSPTAGNGAAVWDAAAKARFEATFAAGRQIRIENEGRYFFRDIQSSDGTVGGALPGSTWPSVTFSTALPECFVPSAWATAAPITHMRYSVQPDSVANLSRLQSASTAAGTGVPGARRAMLVREEWRDDTASVVANTTTLLLDYAVEFAVDGYINTATMGANAARPVWALTRGANLQAATTNTPEALRSLLVTLTARSPEVDPKTPAMPRATFNNATLLDSPLMTVQVIDPAYSALTLYARTRTLRSEIFLQNQ